MGFLMSMIASVFLTILVDVVEAITQLSLSTLLKMLGIHLMTAHARRLIHQELSLHLLTIFSTGEETKLT